MKSIKYGFQFLKSYALKGRFPPREGGVLNIVFYGDVPPHGPTPYPFYTIFDRKRMPFTYLV